MVRHCRLILAALVLLLAGCTTLHPNDPEIFRPVNPEYPMPD